MGLSANIFIQLLLLRTFLLVTSLEARLLEVILSWRKKEEECDFHLAVV